MQDLDEVIGTGETVAIAEKVVVSPSPGKFRPLPPEVFTSEGEWVEAGGVLAEVDLNGTIIPVCSPHRGWVMGMLAVPGQPVRSGEALFWIWGG